MEISEVKKIKTRKIENNLVKLRFEDDQFNSIYQDITTNNLDTAIRYAKKVETANGWLLVELYQVFMTNVLIWVTKYYIRYTERGGKMIRLKRPQFELFMNLVTGEILRSPGVTLSQRFYQDTTNNGV